MDPEFENHGTEEGKLVVKIHYQKKTTPFIFETPTVQNRFRAFNESLRARPFSDLCNSIQQCNYCSLRVQRGCPMIPEGNREAEWVVVTRNPSSYDGATRKLLDPTSLIGKVFTKYLEALGLYRKDIYLTCSNFCHDPSERHPTKEELFACSVFKLAELSTLPNMKNILLMGNDAQTQFFGLGSPNISRVFQDVYSVPFAGRRVNAVPVYHPGHLINNAGLLSEVLSFLKLVGEDNE